MACSPPPCHAGAAAPDPQNAITGLLIHCCADGLAMGAAFLSGNARLSMIIAAGELAREREGRGARQCMLAAYAIGLRCACRC